MSTESDLQDKIIEEVKREARRLLEEAGYGASRIALDNLGVAHFDQDEAEQLIWTELFEMMDQVDRPAPGTRV